MWNEDEVTIATTAFIFLSEKKNTNEEKVGYGLIYKRELEEEE